MLYRIDLKSNTNDAPAVIGTPLVFGPEEWPGSISLDLDGDLAYVTFNGVIYQVLLNGPTSTMEIIESL